jgi:hypothetical protein
MGEHEAGEKFEMIWCGKKKAIGEYIWESMRWEKSLKWFGVAKRKPLEKTYRRA